MPIYINFSIDQLLGRYQGFNYYSMKLILEKRLNLYYVKIATISLTASQPGSDAPLFLTEIAQFL